MTEKDKTNVIQIALQAEKDTGKAIWFQRGQKGQMLVWFRGQDAWLLAREFETKVRQYGPSQVKVDHQSGQLLMKIEDVYSN